MYEQIGQTIQKIRTEKGYSQEYLLDGKITQSAFSKFELNKTDIRFKTLVHVLSKLEVSFEELTYIHNDFNFFKRDKIINDFFDLAYNNEQEIQEILLRANDYLEKYDDALINDIKELCEALLILNLTNDYTKASLPAIKVWKRLSKRNQLYITDLYLLNSILFLFPLETMIEIKKFALKSIERYKNFQCIQRLRINMGINISLMFIKNGLHNDAICEIEKMINLSKEQKAHIHLAICYIRKGICLNNLGKPDEMWILKGQQILLILEENQLLQMIEDEIKLYK